MGFFFASSCIGVIEQFDLDVPECAVTDACRDDTGFYRGRGSGQVGDIERIGLSFEVIVVFGGCVLVVDAGTVALDGLVFDYVTGSCGDGLDDGTFCPSYDFGGLSSDPCVAEVQMIVSFFFPGDEAAFGLDLEAGGLAVIRGCTGAFGIGAHDLVYVVSSVIPVGSLVDGADPELTFVGIKEAQSAVEVDVQ